MLDGPPIRLAIVTAFPVLPPRAGGKIRIVQMARALSRLGVEVTVVAPFHVTQTKALVEQEPFELREVFYPPLIVPFLFVDRPFPYGCLISFHPGYGRMLPVSLADFDVCQFEHPAFVDLARRVADSAAVVYGSQNVEFDYVSAECRSDLVRRVAGGRVRSLEARMIERADHTFACTEGDRRRFRELYGSEEEDTTVIPNGLDLASIDAGRAGRAGVAEKTPRLPRRAIFVGSDVHHNRVAAHKLLDEVVPRFENEIEFVFLGPCARQCRNVRAPNVVVDPDGELADYGYLDAIGLNPVIAGSGSNLKVLYYLAHGLAVLSTPFGMRGYDDLLPWVVTAELDDFPKALAEVAPLPNSVRERLAPYEWNAAAADALRVYETLLGEPKRGLR